MPRSHGFQERRHSSRGHEDRAADRNDLGSAHIGSRGHVERLAHREKPDRDHDDIDAAQQAQYVESEPRLAGQHIGANKANGEPEQEAGDAT